MKDERKGRNSEGKVENLEWKAKKEDNGKLVNIGIMEHKREKTNRKGRKGEKGTEEDKEMEIEMKEGRERMTREEMRRKAEVEEKRRKTVAEGRWWWNEE